MRTFAEMHAQHPTPWRRTQVWNGDAPILLDCNGKEIRIDAIVAMMNAAAKQIANDHLQLCRGYSPECVAACIKAVEAESAYRAHLGHPTGTEQPVCFDCGNLETAANVTMDAAIARLAEETT